MLPVKENRSALFDALDALPWPAVPITHTSTDKGHGRITTRTVQVLPAPPDLPFPHVSQVWLIERHVTAIDGTPLSAVAQLGIASPGSELATPADLARYNRDQWGIDASAPDQGHESWHPCVYLAIGALRLAGRTDITEATGWACRYMNRPFAILSPNS